MHKNIVHLIDTIAKFIKSPNSRELKVTIDEAAGSIDLSTVARAAYHELGNSEVKVSDLKDISSLITSENPGTIRNLFPVDLQYFIIRRTS